MNASDLSIFIFGIYVGLAGITFIIAPNMVLGMMKITPTKEPWIRVLGVVMVDIAILMVFMALYGVTQFYWATVYSRIWIFVGFTALVLTRKAPIQLLGFGVIDLGGGIWTFLTMT